MDEKSAQEASARVLLPEGYEIRSTQVEFIEEASKSLKNNGIFLGSAPCGTGKSIGSLLAVLPFLSNRKVLICFRTRSQLHVYLKELRALKQGVTAASFFSKRDMCPLKREGATYFDFLEECRRLRKNADLGEEPFCEYYRNINLRRRDAEKLAMECAKRILSPLQSVKWMSKHGFCAYEAMKDVLSKVDIFLGTYHYAFDPFIRDNLLRSMKADLSDVYLIVDEAHNLPMFSRELLSDQLSETTLENAIRECEAFEDENRTSVQEYLDILNEDIFIQARSRLDKDELKWISPDDLGELFLERLKVKGSDAAEAMLEYGEKVREERDKRGYDRIFSYNYRAGEFLKNFFQKGEDKYMHLIRKDWRDRLILEVRGFDGREITDPVLRESAGSILMSGFISPPIVYRDLVVHESSGVRTKEFESPFPQENRLILSAEGVSSRYENRTQETLDKWAEYIEAILRANRGNVAVFATSYQLMHRLLSMTETDRQIIREEPKTNRKAVVSRLNKSEENVLFGVMGGKLSEGVDYPNNILKCVAAIGLPYATWDAYQRALINYYDHQFQGKGRRYAYMTPAILRLIQACGRVHRSRTDKGCIVILDERVNQPSIRQLLPGYFQREMKIVTSPAKCSKQIEQFWNSLPA